MAGIERTAWAQATQGEQAQDTPQRMACGARWIPSSRRDINQELQGAPRREDVVRSEVFFDSTCCWV